jgi:hypothetical protein
VEKIIDTRNYKLVTEKSCMRGCVSGNQTVNCCKNPAAKIREWLIDVNVVKISCEKLC